MRRELNETAAKIRRSSLSFAFASQKFAYIYGREGFSVKRSLCGSSSFQVETNWIFTPMTGSNPNKAGGILVEFKAKFR